MDSLVVKHVEIKKCTQADYAAFLDVLNDAFNYGRTNEWFQKNMPHCAPYPAQAQTEEIERHFMCIIDGHIAGGLGAYPLDWVVSNASGERRVISAYGIGQVCCLPEFRNQGVMSALMEASKAEMLKQGRTMGYLGGDRRRYGYFGYDFGVCNVSYYMDAKLLQLAASPGVAIREANIADWPAINEAYETLPSYIKRSPRNWELQFLRTGYKWFIGECDSRKGFMCAQSQNNICEVYGDAGVLAAMLLDRANGLEKDKGLYVQHAAENTITTPVGRMICGAAGAVNSRPVGLFAVINAEKMLDELGVEHSGVSNCAKEDIARQLINFWPLPGKIQGIQPLCAWIPGADGI